MAKSARASNKKRNNAALRAKVFGPAHDARMERLSAKLQEIANAPKPDQDKEMEVEQKDETAAESDEKTQINDEAMQWGGLGTKHKSRNSKISHRVGKSNTKRKPRNQVVFPSEVARRKRVGKSKKG